MIVIVKVMTRRDSQIAKVTFFLNITITHTTLGLMEKYGANSKKLARLNIVTPIFVK